MSSQSTPVRQRTSSDNSLSFHKASHIDYFLTQELTGLTVCLVADSFLQFADLSDLWSSPGWSAMMDEIKNNATQEDLKQAWIGVKGEIKQYPSFCEWVECLITFLTKLQRPAKREVRFLPLGTTKITANPGFESGNTVPGTSYDFQPDVVCVSKEVEGFSKWGQVLIPLEFKQKARSQPPTETITAASSTPSSRDPDAPGLSTQSSQKLPKTKAGAKPSSKRPSPMAYHVKSGPAPDDTEPKKPTLPPYNPTHDDIQLARYAMETFAAVGDRTHVFGMAVARPEFVLWYFDRCGAVRSPALNVGDHEGFLAFIKFLSAIIYMEDSTLGFNPFFTNATGANPGVRTNLCELSMDIPDFPGQSLDLIQVLDRRSGIVGRASLVHRANLQRPGKTDDVVLKSSWQHVTRKSEAAILEELHSSPQAHDHIVKFFHGWEQPDATGTTLRSRFGQPIPPVAHDRALRHTITEYLNPITALYKPFHIPHIGWSVLQAIKFLNNQGWFHRDISIGNMGFTTVTGCDGVVVKLHDFDLSEKHGLRSGTPDWIGTLPFMSIELLAQEETDHMIGFDVEALIWTLLWIVKVYTDGKDPFKIRDHPLKDWFSASHSLKTLASIKENCLREARDLTNPWYKTLEAELSSLAWTFHKMREEQQDVRYTTGNNKWMAEDVYGLRGLTRIEEWMTTAEHKKAWDVLRKP
ncbi:hypothetical protein FRC01_002000, partial [Tulasnella sp. 417]